MNAVLWILAILLAAAFALAGLMKVSRPKEKLISSGMAWAEDFSPGMVRTIGLLEVLAAIGLILPGAFDVAPVLVPLAALGLVAMMVGAAITHLRRGEGSALVAPVVLGLIAAVVAWGRFGPYNF